MLDKLREDDALWEDFEEIFHALVACRVNLTKSDSSVRPGPIPFKDRMLSLLGG